LEFGTKEQEIAMKLTIQQLIQTICDLMDGNCDPGDIRRETGWDIEKCKELSDIAKACLSGEVEIEEMAKIGEIYAYVNDMAEDNTHDILQDSYYMGMYRGATLTRNRFLERFPNLKIAIDK
jgi:hypothetical protein